MTAAVKQQTAPPATYAAAAVAIPLRRGTAAANRLAVQVIDPLLASIGRTAGVGAAPAAPER